MRLDAMLALLLFTGALAGCDDDDDDDFASVSCTDINGQFVATDLLLTSLDDRGFIADFGDSNLTLGITGSTFTSSFDNTVVPSFNQAGPVAITGDDLILGSQPIIPGTRPGAQTFFCVTDGRTLHLTSTDVGFDFDDDGRFDDALLEARFEAR